MRPQELKRAMAVALEYSNSFEEVISDEVHDAVIGLLRREWDMRVLDAWARSQGHGFSHHCVQTQSGSFVAQGTDGESIVVEAWVLADTEDAARHAAALAVWPDLKKILTPEELEDIGEYP